MIVIDRDRNVKQCIEESILLTAASRSKQRNSDMKFLIMNVGVAFIDGEGLVGSCPCQRDRSSHLPQG